MCCSSLLSPRTGKEWENLKFLEERVKTKATSKYHSPWNIVGDAKSRLDELDAATFELGAVCGTAMGERKLTLSGLLWDCIVVVGAC